MNIPDYKNMTMEEIHQHMRDVPRSMLTPKEDSIRMTWLIAKNLQRNIKRGLKTK